MIGSENAGSFHGSSTWSSWCFLFVCFLRRKKNCIDMKAFTVLAQSCEDPLASPAALTPSVHRDAHGRADVGLPCAQTPPLGSFKPPMASAFHFCLFGLEDLLGYVRELLIMELQTFEIS